MPEPRPCPNGQCGYVNRANALFCAQCGQGIIAQARPVALEGTPVRVKFYRNGAAVVIFKNCCNQIITIRPIALADVYTFMGEPFTLPPGQSHSIFQSDFVCRPAKLLLYHASIPPVVPFVVEVNGIRYVGKTQEEWP